MKKIRVIVVDDSAVMRAMLKNIIASHPDLQVVDAVPDPLAARESIRELDPDVVTLDVEMPHMDGLDFLERLMRLRPTPVLMVSTLTASGSETAMQALELGAVDVIAKPGSYPGQSVTEYGDILAEKIRVAAKARLHRRTVRPLAGHKGGTIPPMLNNPTLTQGKVLVFGASTGGTEALKDVLVQMPADAPGIVIAQHMPEGFTRSFAMRLDTLCRINVKEAEHGEPILPGHAYIAPGHSHLLVGRHGGKFVCELSQADPVNRHRPSVDVLFHSAATQLGKQAVGVILTGMGKDGALGLKAMHDAGAYTFAQDEASCIVFGMPREAIAQGGVDEIVPLERMTEKILARLQHTAMKSSKAESAR